VLHIPFVVLLKRLGGGGMHASSCKMETGKQGGKIRQSVGAGLTHLSLVCV
jgi:hypothetical protein